MLPAGIIMVVHENVVEGTELDNDIFVVPDEHID
jgi:hypothetical protein